MGLTSDNIYVVDLTLAIILYVSIYYEAIAYNVFASVSTFKFT